MTSQTPDDYVRTVTRGMLHDVFVDDYRQKLAIQREAHATNLGLNPYPYCRPFPGSSVNVQLPPTIGKLWPAIATAVITALGMLAWAGWSFRGNPEPPSPPSPPPPNVSVPFPDDQDTRYDLDLRVE